MKGIRGISLAVLALVITSCAQPEMPKATDDWAPIIGQVRLDGWDAPTPAPRLVADVYDNVGVTRIEFYIGANKVGEVDTAGAKRGTYSVNLSLAQAFSCRSSRAVAYDAAGNYSQGGGSTICVD